MIELAKKLTEVLKVIATQHPRHTLATIVVIVVVIGLALR